MRQVPQSVIWICFLTFVHSCPFGAKEHRTSSIFNLSIVMRLFYHFKFRLSTAKSAGRAALLCGHRFNLFCRLFCRTKNLPTKAGGFLIITREAADSARSSVCRISVYSNFCQSFYQSTPMQSLAIASASGMPSRIRKYFSSLI